MLFVLAAFIGIFGMALWLVDAAQRRRQREHIQVEETGSFKQHPIDSTIPEKPLGGYHNDESIDAELEEQRDQLPETTLDKAGEGSVIPLNNRDLSDSEEREDTVITADPTVNNTESEPVLIDHPRAGTARLSIPGVARRSRKHWAQTHGFEYVKNDPYLTDEWSRGAAAHGAIARDVVSGIAAGHEMYVCDLNGVTVMAMRRSTASEIVIDARRETIVDATAEESEDLIAVATQAGFKIFGSEHGPAQRMVDIRTGIALGQFPISTSAIWLESEWALAQFVKGTDPTDWDTAMVPLAAIAEIARVLPPNDKQDQAVDFGENDPTRPLLIAPVAEEEITEEPLPVMPKIERKEQTLEFPSRAAGISKGVVEPRSIGGDDVAAIAEGTASISDSFYGTRMVRNLSGNSSIFEDLSEELGTDPLIESRAGKGNAAETPTLKIVSDNADDQS